PDLAKLRSFSEEQLAIGKQRLDQGHYGLAIQAFSNAQLSPEQSAAAYNGMAIAYLQLGRPDLAEHFFRQAIAGDPSCQRYQVNLSRFYTSVAEDEVRKASPEAPELASADAQAGDAN